MAQYEETLTELLVRLESQLVSMRLIDNKSQKFKRSFCRFFDNKNFPVKRKT